VDEAADGRIISKSMAHADEHFVQLWSERYVVALPPSHPLTLKDRLRPADLAGVAMVDRCHCEQSALFDRAPKGETVAIAESEDWAMALVAAGVGIAIVPEGVARANPDVTVREIDAKVKREVGLAYSAKSSPCEPLHNFIAMVGKQRQKSFRQGKR
jgi:DNA-binding transcriptional LysR family regulator